MRHNGNAFGFPLTDEIVPADELAGRRTILDAIDARLPGADVQHARGTGIHDGTDAEIAAAVELARSSEVAIVVLGERSGLTDDATTGEFRDRLDLGFMGRQQELLEAVVATGTPVVLVVVSGRPLAIEWAAGHCAAVLLAWVPGEAGPEAIVAALVGDENPGRQAADLRAAPRRPGPGLVPPPSDRRTVELEGRLRRRLDDAALAVRLRAVVHLVRAVQPAARPDGRSPTDGGEITVSADVTNTGDRRGDEVVQLYVRDPEATVARPVLELRGFRRVGLAPGERRTVSFRLSAEQFAYVGADYRRVVEPGVDQGLRRQLVGRPPARRPVRARRADRPARRAAPLPDRDRACLTPGRSSTRPASSARSTTGSSVRSWSTWVARSTAASTSRATRRPMATAGATTSSTSSASSVSRSFAIPAATSCPATTGRTASVRGPLARSGWIAPGARSSRTPWARTTSSPGRGSPASSRCSPSTLAPAGPMRRGTWSSTATLRSARAYADRRAANGHPDPHGVRRLVPRQRDGRAVADRPHVGRGVRPGGPLEAGRAMRRVDPSIELVACGSSGSKMPTFGAWEETVLDIAWEVADLVSLHSYYDPADYDSVGDYLACAADLGRMIERVAAIGDAVAARTGSRRRIGLSVDEWNVWHFAEHRAREEQEPTGPFRRAPALAEDEQDVADALVVGCLLITLAAACRPGPDRLPRPAGQRDPGDPDGRRRAGLAPDLISRLRRRRPVRPRDRPAPRPRRAHLPGVRRRCGPGHRGRRRT